MSETPFFPAWRARLAPLKVVVQNTRAQTLPSLQGLFGPWIPKAALAQSQGGPNSRQRLFPLELTFWAFLGQILNPGASCREAVRQVLALFCLAGKEGADEQTGGYCQARQRLPLSRLQQVTGQIAQAARAACPKDRLWRGREIKVVDGSSLTMPDTAANQRVFPQQRMQKPGCGFPIMRFVGLFSLGTGCLLSVVSGSYYEGELSLFRKLWHFLKPRDVLLADRHFSDYGTLATLWNRGVDAVVRQHSQRPSDFRHGSYLGPQDRLVAWTKPLERPKTIGSKLWSRLPQVLSLRMIRIQCAARGFRTQRLVLTTTLLDPEKYPTAEIAQLYLQRWNVELFFRQIKTTLQMEHLRCQSPQMVRKEFFMHLLGYNLMRALMLQTVRQHGVPLERLSFKGGVDAVRQFGGALARARSKRRAAALLRELFRVLASDLVPSRPGRRQPRAVKRRPKPYSLLTKPRHQFVEIPHRGKYRANT